LEFNHPNVPKHDTDGNPLSPAAHALVVAWENAGPAGRAAAFRVIGTDEVDQILWAAA
jgi:hypothetical protein